MGDNECAPVASSTPPSKPDNDSSQDTPEVENAVDPKLSSEKKDVALSDGASEPKAKQGERSSSWLSWALLTKPLEGVTILSLFATSVTIGCVVTAVFGPHGPLYDTIRQFVFPGALTLFMVGQNLKQNAQNAEHVSKLQTELERQTKELSTQTGKQEKLGGTVDGLVDKWTKRANDLHHTLDEQRRNHEESVERARERRDNRRYLWDRAQKISNLFAEMEQRLILMSAEQGGRSEPGDRLVDQAPPRPKIRIPATVREQVHVVDADSD